MSSSELIPPMPVLRDLLSRNLRERRTLKALIKLATMNYEAEERLSRPPLFPAGGARARSTGAGEVVR